MNGLHVHLKIKSLLCLYLHLWSIMKVAYIIRKHTYNLPLVVPYGIAPYLFALQANALLFMLENQVSSLRDYYEHVTR